MSIFVSFLISVFFLKLYSYLVKGLPCEVEEVFQKGADQSNESPQEIHSETKHFIKLSVIVFLHF